MPDTAKTAEAPTITAPAAALHGLYAITPDDGANGNDDTLLARVAAAVAGGASIVQYRNKHADAATRQRQALALAAYCNAHRVHLIINDDVALARQCGAGVHIGAADAPVSAARATLGANAIVGVSCKNSVTAARAAQQAGASYVAMGAVFATSSKADTVPCPLQTLTAAKRETTLPVVAIGGITTDNAAAVIRAGADAIAVISGLFGSGGAGNGSTTSNNRWTPEKITATARAFCTLLQTPNNAA